MTTLHSSYQAGRYIQDKRKKQRGVGKRACHKDGLMDSRQSQASQISSGGRAGLVALGRHSSVPFAALAIPAFELDFRVALLFVSNSESSLILKRPVMTL